MIADVGKDETSTCDFGGNFTTLDHFTACTEHALASKISTRSLEWIIDSGASRHVIGAYSEFRSYTHLTSQDS
jgi:hypothetical protein